MSIRKLVYILAPSYSGSTLLTFLLSTHERIASIGELKGTARDDMDTYMCSCGFLQRECGFWRKVKDEMNSRAAFFSLDDFGTHFAGISPFFDTLLTSRIRGPAFEMARDAALRLFPGCRGTLHKILNQNRVMIDLICEMQGGDIFLDGSKDPVRLRQMSASGDWDVKVICLIRDGRGVTYSSIRRYNEPMETVAKEWVRTSRECDHMARRFQNEKCITVHYESLCRDPEAVLSEIYTFLGLAPELGTVDFRSREHHVLGNSMRLKSTNEIRLDEKWKKALGKKDLEVFERIAGKMNQSYGYE